MLTPGFASQENAAAFRIDDRARLINALNPDTADRVASALEAQRDYNWMMAREGQSAELSEQQMSQLSEEARKELQDSLWADARMGRGFCYRGHRLSGTADPVLSEFNAMLNSEPVLSQIRTLTGDNRIAWADAQATRYDRGNYLTRHLDDPADEKRLYAYVFSFCRNWHPDWGGLLQFYQQDGTPREAWSPGFNALSLFSVRHIHSVTFVTPFAGQPRFSITGWFHAR
ncbi:MAG: 2OG-Fe(II) oxygenase family protein [Pseudomonadota bacterium]